MVQNPEFFQYLQQELIQAAAEQDKYELNTVNLIAPASPTPKKYTDTSRYLRANPIAEGLLGKRPYAGVAGFNKIESIAALLARTLFSAEHANVQPHSVSQANQAAYQALLETGDRVLAMEFQAGGHLTHGMRKNFSGRLYDFHFYGVDDEGLIDYVEMEKQASLLSPKMIVCGASSYPRVLDFEKLRAIADKVGAYVLADLSHPAGLVAAGRFPQPFPHCDVVTFTPDKTLLGPHGGVILCRDSLKERIDAAVHPGVQSSVPLHRILATALCLSDAGQPKFTEYIDRLILNIKQFELEFNRFPEVMVTGGTDTHLLVLNTLKTFGLTGKASEEILENIGILTNRQVVPADTQKPYIASGLRLGTSWITGRGYSELESAKIARIITTSFENPQDTTLQARLKQEIDQLIQTSRPNDVWSEE